MSQKSASEALQGLYDELLHLRQHALDMEGEYAAELRAVPPAWRESARNLVHYLGLRRHDIRPIQVELGLLGLSSLGRLEAHALAGVESVLSALRRMGEVPSDATAVGQGPLNFRDGDQMLARHTEALPGPPRGERVVRIMVTMPPEAARDYALVRELVVAGMDVMRINSAHDDEQAWQKMAQHARRAAEETQRPCQVLFDLCGPKLRTGDLEPGPAVVHFAPTRDERGTVIQPALVWIGWAQPPVSSRRPSTVVPVDEGLASALRPGDALEFEDVPRRFRRILIAALGQGGAWGESRQATYLEPAVALRLVRDGATVVEGAVGEIPPLESSLHLAEGDELVLTADDTPGGPAVRRPDGSIQSPARIPCTLPSIFRDVNAGDPILLDDGKFTGRVREASEEKLTVVITRTPPGGARLRSDKGINLPQSELSEAALTAEDLRNLDFAAHHVDMVGLSFVREPADLYALHGELGKRGKSDLGVVLKIENRVAFENLPDLLLAGLREPPFGVMVARGDLGVELGFDRLAEVQEEILWLCEAAHVPVIWATQVLESLAKKGLPSRAEVTDAAMSGRAECVMLNKGPYVLETVLFLGKILARMRDHHHKKTPMLRRLKVSEGRYRDDTATRAEGSGSHGP